MKKYLMLLFATLFFTTVVCAQLKRKEFSLSVGQSLATGQFGESDEDEYQSGYAGKGLYLNANYKYLITKSIGINFKYIHQYNAYNPPKPTNGLTVEDSNWLSRSLMLGISAQSISSESVSLEVRFLSGVTFLNIPETEYTLDGQTIFEFNSEITSAVGYDLGLGLDIMISKNCSLLFNVDYQGGTFVFDKITSSSPLGATNNIENVVQTYHTLSVSTGLGIHF